MKPKETDYYYAGRIFYHDGKLGHKLISLDKEHKDISFQGKIRGYALIGTLIKVTHEEDNKFTYKVTNEEHEMPEAELNQLREKSWAEERKHDEYKARHKAKKDENDMMNMTIKELMEFSKKSYQNKRAIIVWLIDQL